MTTVSEVYIALPLHALGPIGHQLHSAGSTFVHIIIFWLEELPLLRGEETGFSCTTAVTLSRIAAAVALSRLGLVTPLVLAAHADTRSV